MGQGIIRGGDDHNRVFGLDWQRSGFAVRDGELDVDLLRIFQFAGTDLT